ncbi:T9SS type A sorting domain-containing protein, partial [candidate division KSB1 bacterium]|nr:T9SS type A sorting domain-containing protein [candidate division KSB1 bacterium]
TVLPQDLVSIFSDSPDDSFYDPSWGYRNSPSELELAGGGSKFPVESENVFQGVNSLRLKWTSRSGGDWGIAVASPGWQAFDYTQLDTAIFWVNGPQAIGAAELPSLALEDVNNQKSRRIGMGEFLSLDNDSATWQKVVLPLDRFLANAGGIDPMRIKTLYFFQKAADQQEHILWIDEIFAFRAGSDLAAKLSAPQAIGTGAHDSRVDIKWRPDDADNLRGYFIYRAENPQGPFTRINPVAHTVHIYSDFTGENGKTFYYYVTAVNTVFDESPKSQIVYATPQAAATDELLTSVQQATFRYFYDYGHPVSGLARERKGSGDVVTSGGTGFGLVTLVVGAERGFAPRDSIAVRILRIIDFLQNKAQRYHGAWPHWINGRTGETIPFSQYDNGGDLVETSYAVEGLLTARQYFNRDTPLEKEIRDRATQLWHEVEWDWYRQNPPQNKLYWHWSPNYGFRMNMAVTGFNEAMITYLAAIASPTHGVPGSLFYSGWAGSGQYANGREYYGYKLWVGPPYGGPLFFTHYTFLSFDPRGRDRYCNYYDNNRNISLIHRAYCSDNPENHKGYSDLVWGLTASDNPWGYLAHAPDNDNGTITPTAAISAMPYTPEESIETLKHFYYYYGPRLWGEFGFRDAFNLDADWFASSYLAIDLGTIVPMIENYRTGLCWKLFMADPDIQAMLGKIEWQPAGVETGGIKTGYDYKLEQNYPNPFNPKTRIRFTLPRAAPVTLDVFNLKGENVGNICYKKHYDRGSYEVLFSDASLASGIYFYRLKAEEYISVRKMVLVR